MLALDWEQRRYDHSTCAPEASIEMPWQFVTYLPALPDWYVKGLLQGFENPDCSASSSPFGWLRWKRHIGWQFAPASNSAHTGANREYIYPAPVEQAPGDQYAGQS